MRVGLVVAAGGDGRRMGGVRKQYRELLGEPVLLRALRPFLAVPDLHAIVVALPPEDAEAPPAWLAGLDPRLRVVAGGIDRTGSVRAALAVLSPDCDTVLVHDAARPLVTGDLIERVLRAAAGGVSVLAAQPVADTVKQVDAERRVQATLDRARLWRAQTPQAFPRQLLLEAHERAEAEGVAATDDAALVERLGHPVIVVEGSPENLKITHPLDLVLAEAVLRGRAG